MQPSVQVIIILTLLAILVLYILEAVGVTGKKIVTENSVPIDKVSGHVPVVQTDHAQLHEGRSFHFSELIGSVADDDSQDYLYVPNAGSHLRFWTVSAENGPLSITLYENPTVTDNGSQLSPLNMNRFSDNTSNMDMYKSPTVTSTGTLLNTDTMFNSRRDGAGSTSDFPLEWILKTGNTYLVRITNTSNGTIDVSFNTEWYHTK